MQVWPQPAVFRAFSGSRACSFLQAPHEPEGRFLWGRLALDPTDATAIDALELFASYEEVSVIKASDAESVARGALALVLTRDPAHLERIRPFIEGKKLVGAVAKASAASVKELLEREGLASP